MGLTTKKYFSLREANSLIPKVEKIVLQIIKINNALEILDSIQISYEDDFQEIKNDIVTNKNFHRLYYNLYKKVEKLIEIGCVIKDINLGVVDFYSLYEDREISLCWKLGEKEIKYWHDTNEGYVGRQPVSRLLEKDN
tara:strand:+ start:58083 stop:58496 length:414 start_codon:yes stop_codon:yes gene_type:complete